jgi:hypothetical protein
VTDDTPNPTTPEAPQPADPGSLPDSAPDAAPPAEAPSGPRRPSSADARSHRPEYKGAELDPERGPGLGCFWFQVFVLGFFIVLIPIGLNLAWPYELLAILLFVVIGLLLLTGQTVIFLLRLVAADRRAAGRRRPLASPTKTVGELEDDHRVAHAVGGAPRPAVQATQTEAPTAEAAEASAEPAGEAEPEPAQAAVPAAEPTEPAAEPETAEPLGDAEAKPEPVEAAEAEAEPGAEPAESAGDTPGDAPSVATAESADTPEEPDPGVRQ